MAKVTFDDLVITSDAAEDTPELEDGGSHEDTSETPEVALPVADEAPAVASGPSADLSFDFDFANSEENLEKLQNAFEEKVPSSWNIVPQENEMVVATHIKNGAVFVGTIKEFNSLLRS
jgi:hypothetical protein